VKEPDPCLPVKSLYPKNLHDFIPQMIDLLHGDAAGLGFIEGTGDVAVEGGPGLLVYLESASHGTARLEYRFSSMFVFC